MGCCVSSETSGQGEATPARRVADRPVEIVWEKDDQWEELNELYRQHITQHGDGAARESQQPTAFFKGVCAWVDRRYPDCARADTIEELEASTADFETSDGPCRWPSKEILTLDPCYTGVFLACTYAIAVPLEDGESFPKAGAMLETPQMEAAKARMTAWFLQMETQGLNMDHAEIHIFMGADMVRGKWRPNNKEPTIKRLSDGLADGLHKENKAVAKASRSLSVEPMGIFLPMIFESAINRMLRAAPGGTVWDEGELPFSVANKPFPYPTRILVARDYNEMEQHVKATHYKVVTPSTDLEKDVPLRILRSAEPEKVSGAAVYVTLACALGPGAPWPQYKAFTKTPEMKAAEEALIDLLKKWNREGRVQRCVAEVLMGADRSRFIFVGEKFDVPVPSKDKAPVAKKIEGDIYGFLVKLIEQPKHELFESESQFQAIKNMMQERMMQDPERYKAMAQETMAFAARHFLERNYPGTEVSNQGEFPIAVDGKAQTNTILTVARDPKKEQKNIVAIVYSVPPPDGQLPVPGVGGEVKTWVGTQEMKDAVAALLDLMKQWYKEGKTSEEDCMAQVMMGIDADIYQFVDGERFEDYSDERMNQFSWG